MNGKSSCWKTFWPEDGTRGGRNILWHLEISFPFIFYCFSFFPYHLKFHNFYYYVVLSKRTKQFVGSLIIAGYFLAEGKTASSSQEK